MGSKYNTSRYKLARKYAQKSGITVTEAEKVVTLFFESITEVIKEEGSLTISKFGTFSYKTKNKPSKKSLFWPERIQSSRVITFKTHIKEYLEENEKKEENE